MSASVVTIPMSTADDVATQKPDTLTQRIDHRGRDFGFAGMLRWTDPQDVALFGKLHGRSRSGDQVTKNRGFVAICPIPLLP